MILIITHKEDYTVDYVANKLNKKNIPFFRLNTETLNTLDYKITFQNNLKQITLNNVSDFSSLWFRRIKLPHINDMPDSIAAFVEGDFESLLFNLLSVQEFKKIVSDPYQIYKAENKLLQLERAIVVGFKIPVTLISNSKGEVKSFIKSHNSCIVKPIRSGRLVTEGKLQLMYTSKIDEEELYKSVDDVLTPCIIQNEVEKKYEIRVTVIGQEVFSAKVESQKFNETKLDWRRKKLSFERCEIPNSIKDSCIKLVRSLGLNFGAIDLALATNGDYYFFEINPNGQWAWIELDTGLPIADTLINFLVHEQ